MHIDITYVPKDKCPLDVLAEMGSATIISWIFLHKNAIEKLVKTADSICGFAGHTQLSWKATDKYPETVLVYDDIGSNTWFKVLRINASDIAFVYAPDSPAYLFFLEMED